MTFERFSKSETRKSMFGGILIIVCLHFGCLHPSLTHNVVEPVFLIPAGNILSYSLELLFDTHIFSILTK
jgi:hypothetical protein